MTADWAIKLFVKAIHDYHLLDKLDSPCPKISTEDYLSQIFFQKCISIDFVSGHGRNGPSLTCNPVCSSLCHCIFIVDMGQCLATELTVGKESGGGCKAAGQGLGRG